MANSNRLGRLFPALVRASVTAAMVAVAAYAVWWAWRQNAAHPWTRDGQVMARVVQVAPRVAGPVLAVQVSDNQGVRQGDPLFTLDPAPFEQALKQAQADLVQCQAQAAAAAADVERATALLKRKGLAQQDYDLKLAIKQAQDAAVAAAAMQVATARLKLGYTQVRAPVNGYVTNLQLAQGAFAAVGVPLVALVDTDSFWIAAYFKETDLPHIRIGDPAAVRLLSDPDRTLTGQVESIAFGIAQRNQTASLGSLAEVSPTFDWIRLAQRIPVRIHLTAPPDEVPLRLGLTASVSVNPTSSVSAALRGD
jgi:multidrug resistance efflux pump